MELLFFWLGSVILCFGAELKYEFRMFKDMADEGYKVNFNRINELREYLDADAAKKTVLSLFMPIYNLLFMTRRIVNYPDIWIYLVNSLPILDVCQEMDKYERREYEKKPTGLNAILISTMWEKRIENATVLRLEEENNTSTIYYEEDKKTDEITILRASGPVSRVSYENQIETIKDFKLGIRNAVLEVAADILSQKRGVEIESEEELKQELASFFQNSSKEDERKLLEELLQRLGEEQKLRQEDDDKPLVRTRNKKL